MTPNLSKCSHVNVKMSPLGTLDHVPLKDGHHTSFIVMKCECGEMVGFPSDNLIMALKEGTEETKKQLEELSQKVRAL